MKVNILKLIIIFSLANSCYAAEQSKSDQSKVGSESSSSQETKRKGLTRPPYPPEAEAQGVEGTTKLNLLIEEDGRVSRADVLESSGSEILDNAAVKWAVENWRFIPCQQNGRPVACRHPVKLAWKLPENE